MRIAVLTLLTLSCAGRVLTAQGVDRAGIAGASRLEISMRGTAVVRDSAAWTTLWHRFGPDDFSDTDAARHPPPRVDFNRYMVVIVAGGPGSGCGNGARYVERVVQRRDTLLVDMRGRAGGAAGFYATCLELVNKIDVVRVPRGSKTVVFLGHPRWLPPPARWLDPPDLARLDRASVKERAFFLRAWARDPRTPSNVAVAMARLPAHNISAVADELLKRSDVRADPLALASLAAFRGSPGTDARRLLFDRHAATLLRNRRAPAATLGALIDELGVREPKPEAVASALARHPGVQRDRQLLLRLIRATGTLDNVREYACGIYVRRFPSWPRMSDRWKRGPDRWSHVAGCERLP